MLVKLTNQSLSIIEEADLSIQLQTNLCSQLFRRLISHRTKTVFFQNITHNQSGFKAHLSSSFCIFLVAVKGLKGFDIR